MSLFENQKYKIIPFTCKFCLDEIKFKITEEEYNRTTEFPIKKESVHGEPPHKLIVFLNKNLEIANFKIEDVLEKEVSYSQELTKQVLSEIELTDDEIELYFLTTGRGAVSLGEMAILSGKTKEECEGIAEKFLQKGLYKKIVGATPHYTALPPYAALISQLQNFNSFIREIKESVSPQLQQSLTQFEEKAEGVSKIKEYSDFMNTLKQDLLSKMNSQKLAFEKRISEMDKIKPVGQVLGKLEDDTKQIVELQLEDIKKNFNNIQNKISENLKKLRLGVIQQTVDQVIDKVFTAGLEQLNEKLNTQFGSKLNILLGDLINKINDITRSTAGSGENISEIFADISKNFSKTIVMAEEKLSGISDAILDSFNNLRSVFSTQGMRTLEEVLDKIQNRLEINEKVTAEFWERAKRVTLFSMRDIWFVRSIEGAKAHINEQISKAKMRILIVAPQITDIEINALKALPRHVNVRIAANIDQYSSHHTAVIKELDKIDNVSYRHRPLQNLWGINRDYEEVVLCVISKSEVGDEIKTEIAGIGSIIEEHIKIFVPILEDAWVGAHKETFIPLPQTMIKPTVQIPEKADIIQPSLEKPKIPRPTIEKPVKIEFEKKEKIEPETKEWIETTQPIEERTVALEKEILTEQESIPTIELESMEVSTSEDLTKYLNSIKDQLENKTGVEISALLGKLHDYILNIKGFSGVLDAINRTIADLTSSPGILTQDEKNELQKKLIFWKMKLHI